MKLSRPFGDSLPGYVIRRAASGAPPHLERRLEEEWLAGAAERPGFLSCLGYALGCCWAAQIISRDQRAAIVVATSSAKWSANMTAQTYRGPRLSTRTGTARQAPVVCDINITPLIDVMLVLLVTLIVSLPIMTHAVKLDLPQSISSPPPVPPEVITLDIDFDGTLVWNNEIVAGLPQLDRYLQSAAAQNPQPEIHLHPDGHVKYDLVAKVLALAQHERLQKIGFVNTGEFSH